MVKTRAYTWRWLLGGFIDPVVVARVILAWACLGVVPRGGADGVRFFESKGRWVRLRLRAVTNASQLVQVPGIVAAWRNPGMYGQFVLADIDRDRRPECFGVRGETGDGRGYSDDGLVTAIASDGTSLLWTSALHRTTNQDNHLWCKDVDGDGSFELLLVGRVRGLPPKDRGQGDRLRAAAD